MMPAQMKIRNPAIPPGSLVLVTGVNGLIGSHVADQFLAAGYNVRGTVRNKQMHNWMTSFFDTRYTPERFELVEVKDFTLPGCFDSAMKGVVAVAHTASHVDFQASKPEPTVSLAIQTVLTALESAANAGTVDRVVLTSSSWAAAPPKPDTEYKVDDLTWNDDTVNKVLAKGSKPSGLEIFMVAKTLAEKRAWEWAEKRKPQFSFATVLPSVVLGPVLCPQHQGMISTPALVQQLFNGTADFLDFVEPQWFVDVVDIARLHVAACIDKSVTGERILGYGARFSWNDVLAVFRKAFPEREFKDDFDLKRDIGHVENIRGAQLLESLSGEGWTSLENSIIANARSFTTDEVDLRP